MKDPDKTLQALENYKNLTSKVEAKFQEIFTRHSGAFSCQKGCHQCCAPGLSVSLIEKEAIQEFLRLRSDVVERLRKIQEADPHQGKRCAFLNEVGACEIYEVRPLICRSHGAPIVFKDPEDEDISNMDVCPLNFQDLSLETLPPVDFLNIETVNAILSVINLQWQGFESSGKRTPLALDAILAADEDSETS